MDFRQLELLLAVVDTGSFSRAGKQMFVSQPTVTMQIKALEEELEQQLLERGAQGVKVTPAGRRVYDFAVTALREQNKLLAELGHSQGAAIPIGVAASSVPAQYLLPQLIAAFRRAYPGVQYHVLFCNSADVGGKLLEYKADIGFCGSNAFQDELEYQAIAKDRLIVIAPNDERYSALAPDMPFPESLLQTEPMIVRESGSGTRREFEAWLLKRSGRVDLQIAAVMDDCQAIKNAVVAGMGIAVMSERSAADYIRNGFVLGFPLEGTAVRDLYLVRRKKAKLLGPVKEFYNYVLTAAPELP